MGFRQEVLNAESLRRQDPIKGGETKISLPVYEIGEMGGRQTSLPCEERAGELPAVDAASNLNSKPLVKLSKCHLWNFVFELYTSSKQFAYCKPLYRSLPAFAV